MTETAIVEIPEEVELDRAAIAAEVEAENEINPIIEIEKVPVAEKVEPEPEKKPEEEPKVSGEKEVDKQPAEITPALQDTIDNLSYRLKQAESRVGSLQNQLSAEKKDTKETPVKPTDAPSKEQIEQASKDTEGWEDLKEEFPLWGKAIDGRIAASSADVTEKIDKLTNMETNFDTRLKTEVDKVQTEFGKKLEVVTLTFYHPKWEETVKSDAYLKWLPTQPEHIKAKHGSSTASDAIEVLDRFKESTIKPTKTPAEIAAGRDKRLKESKDLDTTHKEKPAKSEADMTEDELRRKIATEVLDE